jgi:phosphoglycerate kinase
MTLPNLDDLLAEGVSGRFVLVRSDFNVPLDDGSVTDPGRIVASVHTSLFCGSAEATRGCAR